MRRAADKPGVTNLIDILSSLTGEAPEAIESRYDGAGYGQFKTDVGDAVVDAIAPIQERYRELRADPAELQRLLARGRREGPQGLGADARGDVRPDGLRQAGAGRFFGAARPKAI